MTNKPATQNALYKWSTRLSSIKRFNGQKLAAEYSVADHCFRVAMLAMIFVDEYNLTRGKDEQISSEEVLRKALIHDIEESFFGDIPSPAKNITKEFKAAYKTVSKKAMKEEILLGVSEELASKYYKLWEQDKAGESGEVVILADMLEAFATVAYEVKRGNFIVGKILTNYIDDFEKNEKMTGLLKKFPAAMNFYQAHKNMVGKKILTLINNDEEDL